MDSTFDAFLAQVRQPTEQNAITVAMPLPAPRCAISVRDATLEDMAFLDTLQKMHSHMVGFFPRKAMEKYVTDGHVVICEDDEKQPIGYCIARDQYMNRDDVGIIYQLNVLPMKQRHLVGAALIKATFERAAYGCALFCCWCAQDIQANWFWESIGFVPLAFRTGSRAKQRTHIFWQKRVREGDESTPYWYPSKTGNGALAEDRLVLPIPPGTHWRDAKPLLLPGLRQEPSAPELPNTLPGGAPVRPRPEETIKPKKSPAQRIAMVVSQSKHLQGPKATAGKIVNCGGVKYIEHPDFDPALVEEPTKPKRPRKPRQKHDPEQEKTARELRDRYLDAVNTGRLLPPATDAKYEVVRELPAAPSDLAPRSQVPHDRLLDAA